MDRVSASVLVLALLAGFVAAASGQAATPTPAPAPAPGPAAAQNNTVDGLFIVAAEVALFKNATALELSGLPNTTEYIILSPQLRSGSLTQAELAGPAFGTQGTWAGRPQAALSGTYNNQLKTVLLQLNAPVYNPATSQLTFQYVVLPPNSTLPASGGTVNSYASEGTGAEANASNTLPYVTPGSTTFYNASLSIDVVGINRFLTGGARSGLIRVDLGANNCCFFG